MRLALASQPVRNGDVAWNVRCMEDVLRACSGRADTVVFGESVLQGFDCLRWDYARDCTVAAAWTDEPVRHLQAAARENGAAVSFGMIERAADGLYSSQVFLGADGRLIDVFRRVSVGWKDVRRTDGHYREGDGFHLFSYGGIRFATALCGDLWTPGKPEELARSARMPCSGRSGAITRRQSGTNQAQARICRAGLALRLPVLLVNPFCVDPAAPDAAAGGAACFSGGRIVCEAPAGESGILFVEL